MRLRGGGNRALPAIVAIAVILIAAVVLYFLFLAPRGA